MDDLDYRLLAQLRTDGRAPVAALSKRLKVSRATVRSRIDRMIESGVIQGFSVILREGANRDLVRAIMLIKVVGQGADEVVEKLRGFPEVATLHSTNGRWDIVAELEVETLPAFDRCLRQIRNVSGIEATETSILLATQKGA